MRDVERVSVSDVRSFILRVHGSSRTAKGENGAYCVADSAGRARTDGDVVALGTLSDCSVFFNALPNSRVCTDFLSAPPISSA